MHQFARDGVILLGHVRDAHEGQLILAPDLKETLAGVDQFEIDALKKIDDYISRVGLAAPTENVPRLLDGYKQEEVTELNLQGVGISTVVWATGYAFDFSLVKLPVVDSDGYPIQKRGVTRYPGLYFLGLPWLCNQRSGILFGVGDDAAYLAAHIALATHTACWPMRELGLVMGHSPWRKPYSVLRYRDQQRVCRY